MQSLGYIGGSALSGGMPISLFPFTCDTRSVVRATVSTVITDRMAK